MIKLLRPWSGQPQITPTLNPTLAPLAVVIPRSWGAEIIAEQGKFEQRVYSSGTNVTSRPDLNAYGVGSNTTSIDSLRLYSSANATDSLWELPTSQVSVLVMGIRYGTPGGACPLFGQAAPITSPFAAWSINESGAGVPQFQTAAGGTFRNINGSTSLTNNVPFILIGTYDGATMRFYLNGQSIGTLAASGGLTYPIGSDRGPSMANYYNFSSSSRSFVGRLTCAALATRAWSTAEVESLSRDPWNTLLAPRTIWTSMSPLVIDNLLGQACL